MGRKPKGRKPLIVAASLRGKIRIAGEVYPAPKWPCCQPNEPRPRTRAECPQERPCPWIGCRMNLYLEISPGGSLMVRDPSKSPWEVDPEESCALDLADKGEHTLECVAQIYRVTREWIRQIEEKTVGRLEKAAPRVIGRFEDIGIDELEAIRNHRESQLPETHGAGVINLNPSKIKSVGAIIAGRASMPVKHIDPTTVKLPPPKPNGKAPAGWSPKTHNHGGLDVKSKREPIEKQPEVRHGLGLDFTPHVVQPPTVEPLLPALVALRRAVPTKTKEEVVDMTEHNATVTIGKMSIAECIERIVYLEQLIPQPQAELEQLRARVRQDETLQRIFGQPATQAIDRPMTAVELRDKYCTSANNHDGLPYRRRLEDWAKRYPGRTAHRYTIAEETGVPMGSLSAHITKVKGIWLDGVGDGNYRSLVKPEVDNAQG